MINDLIHLSISPLDLIIRAVLVYLAVLILLRIGGKKQMGQMAASEFVAILLISNAVQNSMNGGDNSLVGGLILASVLIFVSWLISVLTYRNKKISAIFEGTPTLLIHRGKLHAKNLAKERVTINELHALLRKQGVHDFTEVYSAILESDGFLSITKTGEENIKPKILEKQESSQGQGQPT